MLKSRSIKLAVDKFPGETIIVDLESGAYYSLRGTASDIWERLEVGVDPTNINQLFSNISPNQINECSSFLQQLKESNLIVDIENLNSQDALEVLEFNEILFEKYEAVNSPLHPASLEERG
jgi:hypothetical protein